MLLNAGRWLRRKTHQCHTRRLEAEKELAESQQPLSFLREQWEDQVKSQTKPLPRQSAFTVPM